MRQPFVNHNCLVEFVVVVVIVDVVDNVGELSLSSALAVAKKVVVAKFVVWDVVPIAEPHYL